MTCRLIILSLLAMFIFACEDKATEPDVSLTSPSNLSIEQLGFESIKLTWQDNSTNEIGFQIDRKIGAGEWEENYRILSENIATFTDLNLLTIGTYNYRIRAINLDDESEYIQESVLFSYNEIQTITYLGEPFILLPEETINLEFSLKDANGELVEREYEVWFKLIEAPLGSIINGTLANFTDSLAVEAVNGLATINLTGGSEEGEILLKAYTYNSTGEEISAELFAKVDNQYPEVAAIEFITADQIAIGTNDSVIIRAELKDEFGDIVLEEYEVFVEFIGRPEGTNFNNEVYDLGEYLTVTTVDGRVMFALNSGSVSGNVGIRLYTYNSSGEEISVAKSNILVQASVPAYCELYPGGINEGEDVGSGMWRIHLDAYLTDVYGNPAGNGISVFFSLPNNPIGAVIETEAAYVGNINDSEPGVAYNFLTFNGAYTNDVITVRIDSGTFSQDYEIVLPLQFPFIDIIMSPSSPDWNWENGIETISPRFTLKDGQNNPINNHKLIFEGTLGMPDDMGSDEDNDAFTELTSYNDEFDSNGMLIKDWVFQIDECPPPMGDEPGTIAAYINVIVEGTDLSQTMGIMLNRNP